MRKARTHYTAEEKAAILRRHLLQHEFVELNDQSSSLFMQEFYLVRQAIPGITKAAALKRAQAAMTEGRIKANGCGLLRSDKRDTGPAGSPAIAPRHARILFSRRRLVLIGNRK